VKVNDKKILELPRNDTLSVKEAKNELRKCLFEKLQVTIGGHQLGDNEKIEDVKSQVIDVCLNLTSLVPEIPQELVVKINQQNFISIPLKDKYTLKDINKDISDVLEAQIQVSSKGNLLPEDKKIKDIGSEFIDASLDLNQYGLLSQINSNFDDILLQLQEIQKVIPNACINPNELSVHINGKKNFGISMKDKMPLHEITSKVQKSLLEKMDVKSEGNSLNDNIKIKETQSPFIDITLDIPFNPENQVLARISENMTEIAIYLEGLKNFLGKK